MNTTIRVLVLLGFAIQASAAEVPRLNILFLFADDWGRYASCYQGLDGRPTINDVIKTPHVDRVAREGVLFKNAFVNAPSCTPCRSSLLSGRYFFQTGRGAILQGAVWDEKIPTFPLLLRDAGYHIGKSFKVWSPGTPADAGFGGQAHAYQKAGNACNNFSEEVTARVAKGMTVAAARDEILAQVRGNFDDFLAARKPGQPWLYWMGTTTTHRSWVKGSGKKLWGIEPDALQNKLPKFLPDVPEVREDVADYLGECQAVDAYVGVLLKRLEETGELEKTVVVLSGDHGMPGVTSGKCNLYDHGTAVSDGEQIKVEPPEGHDDMTKVPMSLWSPQQRRSTAGYYYLVAEYMAMKERDTKKALPVFEAAYSLDPNPFLGGKMLAAKAASGDRSEAMLEARKMVLLYPRDAQLRFFYGEMLAQSSQTEEAITQLRSEEHTSELQSH